MGDAIVVTSGKGGVGKTTTSANLGTALALLGKKVCMVDTDIGLRNLDVVMGLENRIVYDLVDVAEGRCRLQQALVKDKRFEELYMLPAAQTKDKHDVSPEQVRDMILELKKDFDFVIIDCPAGIEQGFRNAIAGADRAIVVTTPENAAVRDADRVIGLLEQSQVASKLVINRIRPSMLKTGDMLDIDEVCQVLAIDLLGIVPDDEKVIKSANAGEPTVMDPSSRAAIAYRNIARRILGDMVPLMPLEDKTGMLKRFRKFLGIG
ncbi:septum site-determining protein MinD [Paenibacillus curdlanolyticus YK9]|uniref:Septum site-determining protein MinD n=1 Tax=Paenibacillus curdlanolyticus YK9 TaxID=717606 RepID=E0IDV1_9BACL|nr:septum site-determining protein MinD [Paenibacillus curdlanolyticus]EFM09305.1 septum site-determining protein MinD [Paenibacillus curdlanolyticus YK9]